MAKKIKEKNKKINENKEPKFMFAIVLEDKYGQNIQLFKTKKQAETFFKELKKL